MELILLHPRHQPQIVLQVRAGQMTTTMMTMMLMMVVVVVVVVE